MSVPKLRPSKALTLPTLKRWQASQRTRRYDVKQLEKVETEMNIFTDALVANVPPHNWDEAIMKAAAKVAEKHPEQQSFFWAKLLADIKAHIRAEESQLLYTIDKKEVYA